jgi:hypothetical protein
MVNFAGHMFSSLPLKRFLNNEFPSEGHVITRLAYNSENIMHDYGGFMLNSSEVETLFLATSQEPYKNFTQRLKNSPDGVWVYQSHLGLQDDLLYPVWAGLFKLRDYVLSIARDGSRWQERMQRYDLFYIVKITQSFVALFNGLIIALVLLWVFKQFSVKTAYISLVLVLALLADFTFFGRSMWWIMGLWFIPFLIVTAALRVNGGQPLRVFALLGVSALAGTALSLKTSIGYEFTSTVMVSAVIPVTFYAVLNGWRFREWFMQCLPIGIFQLTGLVLTLFLHAQALESVGYDPLEILRTSFEVRAHGGEMAKELDGLMDKSVHASFIGVWAGYLFGYKGMGLPQFILMLPLLGWLWARRKDWKSGFTDAAEEKALLTCVALGAFGALSMFTILKGHAYIHGFDVVAWSIPMNLLLMAFYARWLTQKT